MSSHIARTQPTWRPQLETLETRDVPNASAVMAQLAQLRAAVITPSDTQIVQTLPGLASLKVSQAAISPTPAPASAQSLLKVKGSGTLIEKSDGTALFFFHGQARRLGHFDGYAELTLSPDQASASGAVLLRDHWGDLLVGIVTTTTNSRGGQITFSWRNSVALRDGTTVSNTGKFVHSRPPGLTNSLRFGTRIDQNGNQVVIAIIAILIG